MEYSETGTLVRERTLTYVERTSSPLTIKGLAFEKIGNIYHYGQYEMLTGRMMVLNQEIVKEMSQETPALNIQTTIAYTYNANQQPEMITTTHADGSNSKEKFKYASAYTPTTPTDTASVALKALNDSFRHGELIERISRFTPVGGTEKVVGAELITYRDFGSGRILPYYIRSLPQGYDLTESVISGQTFTFDADYVLVKTQKEYDPNGYLVYEFDNRKNKSGYHYAVNLAVPVATFYNAKAQHAIYEGFENITGRGLSSTPFTPANQAGWTGEKAFSLTTSYKLISSAANLINKGEATYRVSCWVKAAQATSITFRAKNGAALQASVILANSVNNQWVYLEGEMNMVAVSNTFTLEVESNNTVTIDDIVFAPKSARIGLTTFRPNTGLTSSTDDRGNSVKYSYDDYRRPLNTFDRNRNVIKRNEYVLQAEVLPSLNPNFSSNTSIYQTDQQIMFTAEANCVGVTYAWLLKNSSATTIATGNNTAFQYTFTALGQYSLTLTVSSIFGQISYSDNICVNNTLISPQISVTHQASTNPLIEYSCYGNDNNKTFTVTNLPFAPGLVKTFVWLILLPSGSWSEIPGTLNLSSIEHSMGGGSYTIRCIVSVQYPDVSCNENMRIISNSTVQVNITYVNNEPCQ